MSDVNILTIPLKTLEKDFVNIVSFVNQCMKINKITVDNLHHLSEIQSLITIVRENIKDNKNNKDNKKIIGCLISYPVRCYNTFSGHQLIVSTSCYFCVASQYRGKEL